MNPVELQVHRLNTEMFIKADPISIVLYRRTQTQNASGGYTWSAPVPLASPQLFRLIPSVLFGGSVPEVRTSTGRLLQPKFQIRGLWNADVERWDLFRLRGFWYEIATPTRPMHSDDSIYQTLGDVVLREDYNGVG